MLLPGLSSKSFTVTVCSMRQVHKDRDPTILFLIILNFDPPAKRGSSRSIIAEPSLDHKLAFAQLTLTTLLGRVLRYL